MTSPRRPDELLVDQLAEQLDRTRQLLTGNPEEAAEAAISRLGAEAETEARIAIELAAVAPLADPERFPAAHRLAVRALEVLDREGFRNPPVGRLGPARVVAEPVVEFIAEFIVKSYAESIASSMRSLYLRREAQCDPALPERRTLARARMEMERLAPGFSGGGLVAPLVVAGGVIVPLLAGIGNSIGAIDFGSRAVLVAAFTVFLAVSLLASWVMLRGAAVAHRRSKLIMRQPLAALWETIGHAGNPPEDDSVMFATIAVTLTTVAWLVIPIGGALIWLIG